MPDNSDVFVRFGADIDPLKKGVKAAGNKLDEFGKKTRSTANALGKVAGAAAIAGAAIGVKLVSDSLAAIDAQAKMAKQLKTTSASLATLNRAADMSGISMKNIESGAKNLEVVMGDAAQGTGAAVKTLDRLNLSAKDFEGIPLDEKLIKINQAIKENIPATEQAAAAATLFGKKAGFAISQLNAEGIKEARRQMEGFGLAISDVDAAKIEAANDAMATVGLAVDGVAQQLTIVLAPILNEMATQFQEAAIQSGGFKETAVDAVQGVASAIGFLGNAFRGIEIAVKTLEIGFDTLLTGALGIGAIFSDELAKAADDSVSEMAKSISELNELMMAPLPSETIEAFVASFTDPVILEAKQAQIDAMKAIDDQAGIDRVSQEEKIQSAMAQIRMSWGSQQTNAVGQLFSDLTTLTQSGNKKMFEVGKAAARANVVLSTYEGAQKAYTALAGIPIVGPALGIAAAGAAIAAGGVRLSAINSTSFGGGGGLAGSGAGAATPAAAVSNVAPAATSDRTIRIEGLDAGKTFTSGQVSQLAEQLFEFQQDGGKLVI